MDGIYVASMVLFDDEGKINKEESKSYQIEILQKVQLDSSQLEVQENVSLWIDKKEFSYMSRFQSTKKKLIYSPMQEH